MQIVRTFAHVVPVAIMLHCCAAGAAPVPAATLTAAPLETPVAKRTPAETKPQKTGSVASEIAEVQKRAARRKDFTVEFRQEVFSQLRKSESESKGTLAFQPPGKFRWEIQGKKRQLYISNGKEFWKYDEANRHAQRLPSESAALDFIDVVTKLSRLSELFTIEAWNAPKPATGTDAALQEFLNPPPGSTDLLVKLTPKQAGQQAAIYLSIAKESGTITEMRILFRNGNRTRLALTNLKEAPVDSKEFDFTPPPGTAVD